ncbi:uncharacterized protein LOC102166013 [Sus scrofa]|uniref:uncharacterized protein LOC102166013 n=1 Tax=Sus scrofa TaxID=9823 RepID=UPI000A2B9707|nr:uncharacterized protein LOC102166013 [Sus scrofa]
MLEYAICGTASCFLSFNFQQNMASKESSLNLRLCSPCTIVYCHISCFIVLLLTLQLSLLEFLSVCIIYTHTYMHIQIYVYMHTHTCSIFADLNSLRTWIASSPDKRQSYRSATEILQQTFIQIRDKLSKAGKFLNKAESSHILRFIFKYGVILPDSKPIPWRMTTVEGQAYTCMNIYTLGGYRARLDLKVSQLQLNLEKKKVLSGEFVSIR